jgi:O-antigen biosynthesis protein
MERKISFIIPTYNLWPMLSRMLFSLYQSDDTYNKQIIVVDNGSTDQTYSKINHLGEAFKKAGRGYIDYIRTEDNIGYLKAHNLGMEKADGDVLFFMNNDILVYPNTISLMTKALFSHASYGMVGGNQLTWQGKPNMLKAFIDTSNLGVWKTEPVTEEDPEYIENDRCSFACAAIKKEIKDKIGLYDERFVPHWFEDDDFAIRLRLAGYKIVIVKSAMFRHYGGASNPTPRYEAKALLQEKYKDLVGKKREEIYSN